MARNGSGAYSLPAGNPVVAGTVIDAAVQNSTLNDIAAELTASLAKDGQTVPTANLPMGGFKHTGAAAGAATGQYLLYGQASASLTDLTVTTLTNTTANVTTIAGSNTTPAATPSTTATGYLGTPVNTQNAAYGFVMTDAGKTIYHDETTARTWTIPADGTIAFPIGTVIILDNTGNSGGAPGAITLSITTDTLRRGDGTAGTGNRTIGSNQVAAIRKNKATEWVITGSYS